MGVAAIFQLTISCRPGSKKKMKLLVLCVCLAFVPAAVPISFDDPHHSRAFTAEKSDVGLGDIWKDCGELITMHLSISWYHLCMLQVNLVTL